MLRIDSGPEFVDEAVQGRLRRRGAKKLYIASGSPWENAYSETFNSLLKDDLLDRGVFETLEAKAILNDHCLDENHRPHRSLEPMPPGPARRRKSPCLDIHEVDTLGEEQLATWGKQAAASPKWFGSMRAGRRSCVGLSQRKEGGSRCTFIQTHRSRRGSPMSPSAGSVCGKRVGARGFEPLTSSTPS